jgi:DNA-binding response OmpR family regulator
MTKIVIVEDEQAIAEMYRFKLQQAGYEVQCALNGQEGLILAKDFQPNLILLDLMMPKMNGEEMLRKLRATDWGKDIKVIILTNMGEQEIPPEIKSLGVSGIVLKSDMTPRQVAELVKKQLGS